MILVSGFNVYPNEVEEVIARMDQVLEVAVIGVPDAKSGEAVKAYIQLKPGETATVEEIMAFCKDNMAGYKRPKYIEFRDTLPMSNVGKVLRRLLRDEDRSKAT
jgi:long-chain acyl-CoA synthetase